MNSIESFASERLVLFIPFLRRMATALVLCVLTVALLVFVLILLTSPASSTEVPRGVEAFSTPQEAADYIKSSFNPLAVTTDIRRPNIAGTDDPAEMAEFNRRIIDATRQPLLLPGPGESPVNPDGSGTGLGLYTRPPDLQIPANSEAMAKARVCAEVKNCEMLADPKYKECGFCIKGGTDVPGKQPGTYTGGLYVDPSDKADADAAGKPVKPSFGQCPPRSDGTIMFFTKMAPCTRESNRQICREVSGFGAPNAGKCALAQPTNTFVYQEPANPSCPVSLRITAPTGSRTTVSVRTLDFVTLVSGVVKNGDGLLTIPKATEGQEVIIVINQFDVKDRGIAAQWEGGANLRVPFDRTLMGLMVPENVYTLNKDTPVVGLARRLRKFGTLGNGTRLKGPSTRISPSATWIWGANPGRFQLVVKCFIPGLFADPTYAEDKFLQGSLPLIGKADTATKAQAGPCNKPGQAPGQYSTDCLLDIYTSSGGDAVKGGLIKTGITNLNQKGSADDIANYLGDLYTQATTGKGKTGGALSVDTINVASQAMFGFDVASPCEDIVANDEGLMGFAPKTAPLDSSCLNYLWTNTGNERSRGDEDTSRSSQIANTYTSIQDRYSGLMTGEASARRQAEYPFRTCQSSGTQAPVLPNGAPNWDAITAVQGFGVAAVQDYYNNIYKTANYTGGNGRDAASTAQAEALKKCYGIKKVPDAVC